MAEPQSVISILADPSSGVHDKIVRSVGDFTVALLGVFRLSTGTCLRLAGTGTLVSAAGKCYILTAAHVWEYLSDSFQVGITLKEDATHQFLMPTAAIAARITPKGTGWTEWGPDLALLRVPSEFQGSILAYRYFYNLEKVRPEKLDVESAAVRILMGTPAESGTFAQHHADLEINGLFMQVDVSAFRHGDYDYFDLDADLSRPNSPQHFGGVSGGGLWSVFVYRSNSTGQIEWSRILRGVAFQQSVPRDGHRIIRCHGPESIRAFMAESLHD